MFNVNEQSSSSIWDWHIVGVAALELASPMILLFQWIFSFFDVIIYKLEWAKLKLTIQDSNWTQTNLYSYSTWFEPTSTSIIFLTKLTVWTRTPTYHSWLSIPIYNYNIHCPLKFIWNPYLKLKKLPIAGILHYNCAFSAHVMRT